MMQLLVGQSSSMSQRLVLFAVQYPRHEPSPHSESSVQVIVVQPAAVELKQISSRPAHLEGACCGLSPQQSSLDWHWLILHCLPVPMMSKFEG
jgi:hypothetical protein